MNNNFSRSSTGLQCFAVKVRSRGEEAVANALRAKKYDVLFPSYVVHRHYSDRVRKVSCALFEGYVFVRTRPEDMLGVVTTDGVSYVVRSGNGLLPLSDAETRTIETLCRMDKAQNPEPYRALCLGQKVRIEAGPLAGLEGVLTKVRDVRKLVVTIETLHSSVSIELGQTRFCIFDQPTGTSASNHADGARVA